ncbi:hypothetical protein [Duganella vulcania]|uniref:Uncharacterized protein n=1 Tax=Duganella vulcania TaxID=2692166 RepID=A0A845H371_9BURK|nr:hypothetical protein [Duganella vulcania]MYM99109.1 hypothetical protein [Duganella vulcania]
MRTSTLLMLCLGLLQGPAGGARDTMLLAHPYPRETSYAPRVLALICADAFQQLNMDADVRGAIEAESGKIDGEVGRAYTYGDKRPNLVRVDEPLVSFRVVAFTRIPDLKISGWDSLKGTSYRVQSRSGYSTFKARLEQILRPLPRLAEILARMKASGAIRRHIARALDEERGPAP